MTDRAECGRRSVLADEAHDPLRKRDRRVGQSQHISTGGRLSLKSDLHVSGVNRTSKNTEIPLSVLKLMLMGQSPGRSPLQSPTLVRDLNPLFAGIRGGCGAGRSYTSRRRCGRITRIRVDTRVLPKQARPR